MLKDRERRRLGELKGGFKVTAAFAAAILENGFEEALVEMIRVDNDINP